MLETAYSTAAPALGRLALMLSSGRGLSRTALAEIRAALDQASQLLGELAGPPPPA